MAKRNRKKPPQPGPDAARAQGEHETGEGHKPVPVNYKDALVQRTDAWKQRGWSKSEVLRQDLDESLHKKKEGGKEEPPLILAMDEALHLLLESVGWKEGEKTFVFELRWPLLLKGCAVFLAAVGKRPPAEVKALAGDMKEALTRTLKGPNSREKHRQEVEDTREALFDAIVGLVVSSLLLVAGGMHVHEAFSEPAKKKPAEGAAQEPGAGPEAGAAAEEPPKVEKAEAVGEVLEAVEGLVSALVVILTRGGGKALGAWLAKFKHEERDQFDAEEKIATDWEHVQGLSEEKQQENAKQRKEEWDKFAKLPAGAARAQFWAELISHVASLVKAVVAAADAWIELHPSDLHGQEWVLQAPWATSALYKLNLEKEAGTDGLFKGTLTARGLAHPEERTFRQSNVVEVEKASCEVTRTGEHPATLKFTWKPRGEESRKLPSPGDTFFAGTEELEEEVEFHSTRLLTDALKIGLPAGEFVRKQRLGGYVKFGVAVLRCVAGCWGVLPRKQREEANQLLLEKLSPLLEKFFKARTAAWRVLAGKTDKAPFTAGLELEKEQWILRFGFQSPRGHANVGWDFAALMEVLLTRLGLDEGEEKGPATRPNGLVPISCDVGWQFGHFGEISVGVVALQKKAAARKDGTLTAVAFEGLKKLPLLGDELVRFEEFCKLNKIAVYMGPPKVRGTKPGQVALPGLEIPLVCDMEELELASPFGGAVSFPATVTLTYTATADVVANLLPELRAVLMAWDVGWTIGSIINELPCTQVAMETYGKWYVEWASREGWSKEYLAMDEWVLGLQTRKWICHGDAVVAFIKSPYLAARHYNAAHGILNHVVPLNDHAIGYRGSLAGLIYAASKDPHALGVDFKSIGHAMALAHVLGHDEFIVRRVEDQLAAEVEGKRLTAVEADFYRFYLYPGEYDQRRAGFLEKHKAEREQLRACFAEGELSEAKAVIYERVFEFVNDKAHKQYIELLWSPFPEPTTENSILVQARDGRWGWTVQRSMANEEIRVELMGHNFVLPDPVLDRADHSQALRTGCNIHLLNGDFSSIKGALAKVREKRDRPSGGVAEGALAYVRVIGEDGKAMEGPLYFLETNEQGEVVSAWRG